MHVTYCDQCFISNHLKTLQIEPSIYLLVLLDLCFLFIQVVFLFLTFFLTDFIFFLKFFEYLFMLFAQISLCIKKGY